MFQGQAEQVAVIADAAVEEDVELGAFEGWGDFAFDYAGSNVRADGLVALPYITQRNPLDSASDGGGMFIGASAQTTREDMLRALAAGMAFDLARVFENTKRSGRIDSVALGGGASRGAHFRTLIAALFAPVPVRWQRDEHLSAARGSLYAFGHRAARAKTQRIARPSKTTLRDVQRHYERYLRACATVEGAVSNSAAIV